MVRIKEIASSQPGRTESDYLSFLALGHGDSRLEAGSVYSGFEAVHEHTIIPDHVDTLGSAIGIEEAIAQSEGLFTATDLAGLTADVLSQLVHPNCLSALREGRTNIDQLKDMTHAELQEANETDEYPATPAPGI